jgi:hypothetical protein
MVYKEIPLCSTFELESAESLLACLINLLPTALVPSQSLSSCNNSLGVHKGDGWRNLRKVTGWDNPQYPSNPPEIMA